VSRSDVTRPLPPCWELVLPPPEVVDDARLLPNTAQSTRIEQKPILNSR
jgi:hypothetical protein